MIPRKYVDLDSGDVVEPPVSLDDLDRMDDLADRLHDERELYKDEQ